MAKSGSKTVYGPNEYLKLVFSWEETNVDKTNNRSTISYSLKLYASNISSNVAKKWSVTINGTNYTGSTKPSSGWTTLKSGTMNIAHNSDGSKSFSYSFYYDIQVTWSGKYVGRMSGSSSGTLTTIQKSESVGSGSSSGEAPVVSAISVTNANSSIANKFGSTFIQNKSTLKINITAKAGSGKTIKSYKTTIEGVNYSGSSFTSKVIKKSGSLKITTTVTDSKGMTATYSTTKTVLAYSPPKISKFRVERTDSSGALDPMGTYAKVTYSSSVSSLNSVNTVSHKITYGSTTVLNNTSSYSLNTSTQVYGMSTTNSYTFTFVVSDFFSSTTVTAVLGSGFYPLTFYTNGSKGVALGKVANREGIDFSEAPMVDGKPMIYFKETTSSGRLTNINGNNTLISGSVIGAEEIPQGVDLKTLTKTGIYHQPLNVQAKTEYGYPSELAGFLEVVAYEKSDTNKFIKQTYTTYTMNKKWERTFYESGGTGVWYPGGSLESTEWELIYSKAVTGIVGTLDSCVESVNSVTKNGVVYINFEIKKGTTKDKNWAVLGYVNAGYRPSWKVVGAVSAYEASADLNKIEAFINGATGRISLLFPGTSELTGAVGITFTYPIM